MCPVYEYECQKCKVIQDDLVLVSELKTFAPKCRVCQSTEMNQVVSAPKGVVRGSHNPVRGQYVQRKGKS